MNEKPSRVVLFSFFDTSHKYLYKYIYIIYISESKRLCDSKRTRVRECHDKRYSNWSPAMSSAFPSNVFRLPQQCLPPSPAMSSALTCTVWYCIDDGSTAWTTISHWPNGRPCDATSLVSFGCSFVVALLLDVLVESWLSWHCTSVLYQTRLLRGVMELSALSRLWTQVWSLDYCLLF